MSRFKQRPRAAQGTGLRQAWLLLCLASYVGLALGFQLIYHAYGGVPLRDPAPVLFGVGWSLILTAVAVLLPGRARKVYLIATILLFGVLTLAHGTLLNLFNRFFAFSDLGFAGDGAAFADLSYIQIPKRTLLLVLLALLTMAAAALLSPKGGQARPLPQRLVAAGAGAVVGILCVLPLHQTLMKDYDVVVWDGGGSAYANFMDTKKSLCKAGLYQYTFRDLWRTVNPFGEQPDGLREELAATVFGALPAAGGNEMTGALAGRNLLLIQLEAIDTWMLNEQTMPSLYNIRENALDFTAHYTPAYITAGTFNTEFIVNTGLIPPRSGVPVDAYAQAEMPYSLAHLFQAAGYTARSFHGSPGSVYNRGDIHANWGYTYHSGADLGMADFTADSQLMEGYDLMTGASPFFSFVITYSGHGPYTDAASSSVHYEEMKALYPGTDDVFLHAMAHARETDLFVGALFDRLEADGLLENTVVVFYADHYNYYVMNDALVMQYKDVYDMNLLQRTPLFLYAADLTPRKVEEVSSSADLLPTLVNLFGLDAAEAWYAGIDLFSPEARCVFFSDGTWYDGAWYSKNGDCPDQDYASRQAAKMAETFEISRKILLSDYYASSSGSK